MTDHKRTLGIIWAGMVGSIATYWVIKALMAGGVAKPSDSPLPGQIFIVLAAAVYGFAYWWFSWVVGGIASRCAPPHLSRLTAEERGLMQLRLQNTLIVCMSGVEAPVIFGLIHSFISTAFPYLFEALALASLAGLAILRATAFPTIFSLMDRLNG